MKRWDLISTDWIENKKQTPVILAGVEIELWVLPEVELHEKSGACSQMKNQLPRQLFCQWFVWAVTKCMHPDTIFLIWVLSINWPAAVQFADWRPAEVQLSRTSSKRRMQVFLSPANYGLNQNYSNTLTSWLLNQGFPNLLHLKDTFELMRMV